MRLLILSALCLLAALAAGCNLGFLHLHDSAPAGLPAWARGTACPGPDCAQNAAGAGKSASGSKPLLAGRDGTATPSLIGPRLSLLLARDNLEKLVAGRIVLEAPQKIKAGAQAKVEARLTDDLREEFVKSLKELGINNADAIAAASAVKANLSGDAFEVVPPAGEERGLDEGTAAWSWEVTAVRAGLQPLLLTLTARVNVPGSGEEEKDLPAVMKKVAVESATAATVGGAVRDFWLWIAGALLLTGIGAAVLRRRAA